MQLLLHNVRTAVLSRRVIAPRRLLRPLNSRYPQIVFTLVLFHYLALEFVLNAAMIDSFGILDGTHSSALSVLFQLHLQFPKQVLLVAQKPHLHQLHLVKHILNRLFPS